MTRTILLTRDAQGNRESSRKLRKRNVRVLSWPSFRYKKTSHKIKNAGNFDWVIFTSVRAVLFFRNRRVLREAKIAAVGPETARALKQAGLGCDLIPHEASQAGLAREKIFRSARKLRILLVQAQGGRADFVRRHGRRHTIKVFTPYRKIFIRRTRKNVERLKSLKIDWVLFYSPSAVDAFLANFKKGQGIKFLKLVNVGVIGKTTAAYLRRKGVSPSERNISLFPTNSL